MLRYAQQENFQKKIMFFQIHIFLHAAHSSPLRRLRTGLDLIGFLSHKKKKEAFQV